MARCFPGDFRRRVALDASVVINLNATSHAAKVLGALPNHAVIVDIVHEELMKQADARRNDGVLVKELIAAGLIEAASLSDEGLGHFEALVAGHTGSTLDDGEAATIAWAIEQDGIAAIDERKASNLVRGHFPALPIASTVDILLHEDVSGVLGPDILNEAIFLALRDGRMRVLEERMQDVLLHLRPEQIVQCRSLPARYRVQVATSNPPMR